MIKDKKLFMKIKLPNAKIPFNELSPSERNKQVKLIGDYYVTLRIYIVDKNKHKNINSVKRVYFKDSMSKNKYRSEIICRNHEIIFTTATFPEYSDNEKVSTITNFNGSKVNISVFDLINTLTPMKTDLFTYIDGQFILKDSRYSFYYKLSKSK